MEPLTGLSVVRQAIEINRRKAHLLRAGTELAPSYGLQANHKRVVCRRIAPLGVRGAKAYRAMDDLGLSVSACLHLESPHASCRENSTYAAPYFGGITDPDACRRA